MRPGEGRGAAGRGGHSLSMLPLQEAGLRPHSTGEETEASDVSIGQTGLPDCVAPPPPWARPDPGPSQLQLQGPSAPGHPGGSPDSAHGQEAPRGLPRPLAFLPGVPFLQPPKHPSCARRFPRDTARWLAWAPAPPGPAPPPSGGSPWACPALRPPTQHQGLRMSERLSSWSPGSPCLPGWGPGWRSPPGGAAGPRRGSLCTRCGCPPGGRGGWCWGRC